MTLADTAELRSLQVQLTKLEAEATEEYGFLVKVDELTPFDKYFHDQEVASGNVNYVPKEECPVCSPEEKKGFWASLLGF